MLAARTWTALHLCLRTRWRGINTSDSSFTKSSVNKWSGHNVEGLEKTNLLTFVRWLVGSFKYCFVLVIERGRCALLLVTKPCRQQQNSCNLKSNRRYKQLILLIQNKTSKFVVNRGCFTCINWNLWDGMGLSIFWRGRGEDCDGQFLSNNATKSRHLWFSMRWRLTIVTVLRKNVSFVL